jgi:hypothetical protein
MRRLVLSMGLSWVQPSDLGVLLWSCIGVELPPAPSSDYERVQESLIRVTSLKVPAFKASTHTVWVGGLILAHPPY